MSDERERVTTGAVWESQVGYCRAVRSGAYIHVSGTAPVASGGGVHAPGDGTAQARRCIEIIAGAHAEAFGAHPPATTMVQVAALIDPEMLIEIEAEAILPC
jgi:isochorismate pyruvate lyase